MNFKTDISFRKQSLIKLLDTVIRNEDAILQALYNDFKKSAFEAVLTETSYVTSELKNTIKSIASLAKPKRVFPSLANFPSRDYIYSEPYGKVLVIAPWNYPYQLALCPLIAAVAAGNQVVVKPSELTPQTAAIIAKIVAETFDADHVDVIQGGTDVANDLLTQRWDYIFFTGSVPVGKIVAKAAAEFLTPVTLELGGKNPCIIDQTASLKLAAKRIVWGKFINAGQTCIAPDYILIQNKVKAEFIAQVKEEITTAFGENPQLSADYPRIVNHKNWKRLVDLLFETDIVLGGQTDAASLYIAPTVVDEPSLDSAIMKEEIFGPLLPIISYESPDELHDIISKYEKPLSLYVFSTSSDFIEKTLTRFSFGGGCVNDTVIHFANHRLPFGGVGHSGIGAYHGKFSFRTFSHQKSIVKKANWLDLPLRYAPYNGKLKLIKKLLKWL
ncbi:MAG: aldehyde dehydrogenase [Burkholderiales bacterium]|nr:aldehyde dehydrogenase [Flavobacterium sp.]